MSQAIQIDAVYVADKLKSWALKSGKSEEELKTQFLSLFGKVEGSTDAIRYKKALNLLKKNFETNMNSAAVMYKVVLVGASTYDGIKYVRKTIMERYKNSPAQCLAKGEIVLIDDVPTPMDINKTFAKSGKENPFYGKPLPQYSWTVNCTAFAMNPTEDKKWFPATVVLRGDEFISNEIPFLQELDIRLNGVFNSEQGKYILNSSKGATNFSMRGQKMSVATSSGLIDSLYGDKFVMAKDLEDNLEQTKSDPSRIVVTEGILNRIFKGDNGKSNSITLSDETLDIGETIRAFVDDSASPMLKDLEDGEEVSLIGRTYYGKGYNAETKQKTDELEMKLTVYGIIPRPE